MSKESIKVCCRFRKEFDHAEDEYDAWGFDEEAATIYYGERNTKSEKKWVYDYILIPDCTQEQMYEKVAKKTVVDFTEGYNGTIFAYGQSGSGKTYSMLGPDSVFETLASSAENELYGITPRAVYQIFNIFKDFERSGTKWKLTLSYIEIYNEKVKCLLSKKDGLKIREDPNEGFVIPEKESIDCNSPLAVFEGINLASRNRATGATNQNERSSRSHAILQLELIYNSIDGLVRKSHLSLVDLAGSERIAKTGAEGQRLKEAQKINQSLTTLGMVIMSLTTPGCKHIPFRNSKLTLILKDSLGGSSKTTLLCTASRLKRHSEESIQTLYFASRAKTIKNNAKKNIILSAGELQYLANGLKKEIMLLRGQLKNVGYQWRLIEDKKILSFCNNDEFLNDPNSPVAVLEKKEENKETKEKIEENIYEENNENNAKENGGEVKIIKVNDKEKDEMIELLKTNMKTERELLQLIINELNEKLDKKEKENMQLLMTISQLKQKVDPKELEKIIPPTGIQNISDTTQKINKEEIKDKKENINNNIKNEQLNIPTGITFDISQFEKEKDELKFELEKKDSEIKQLKKEKEQIEEQNVFTIHQLRQKISELKLQIEVLQTSSSNNSLYSMKEEQDYDFKKKLPHKNRDKTPESKKSSQIRSTFGVVLKKVSGGKGNIDYILQAQEENARRLEDAKVLYKNSELYQSLHKNVIEYDSPLTVSSNSDILDIDMPELNFADNNNGEEFKKVEEELYSKELQHLKAKKEKQMKA
jgi:kinesin family protein 5